MYLVLWGFWVLVSSLTRHNCQLRDFFFFFPQKGTFSLWNPFNYRKMHGLNITTSFPVNSAVANSSCCILYSWYDVKKSWKILFLIFFFFNLLTSSFRLSPSWQPHSRIMAACTSLMAAYTSLQGAEGQRWALLSGDGKRARGNGTELHQRRVRERPCPRGPWAWSSSPGQRESPRAAGAQGALEHCSQTLGLGGLVWSQGMDSMILAGPFQLRVFYGFTYLGIVHTEIRKHNFECHHFILRASMGPITVLIPYKYFIFFLLEVFLLEEKLSSLYRKIRPCFLSMMMLDLCEQVPNLHLTHS